MKKLIYTAVTSAILLGSVEVVRGTEAPTPQISPAEDGIRIQAENIGGENPEDVNDAYTLLSAGIEFDVVRNAPQSTRRETAKWFDSKEEVSSSFNFCESMRPEIWALIEAALELDSMLGTLMISDFNYESIYELFQIHGHSFDGVSKLTETLKANRTIFSLNFNGCDGMGCLTCMLANILEVNHTITTLDLSWNGIDNEEARALAEALTCQYDASGNLISGNDSVTVLNLAYNDIGDEGAIALAEMLKTNRTLTHIDLRHTNITEIGAEAIYEALKQNLVLVKIRLPHGLEDHDFGSVEDVAPSAAVVPSAAADASITASTPGVRRGRSEDGDSSSNSDAAMSEDNGAPSI